MSNESWHDIMSLLGLVILADDRVYKEEVDTFVKSAIDLNKQVNPGLFMTKAMALGWFVDNRDRLKSILTSSVSAPKIDRILGGLSRARNRQEIVTVMEDIARADKNYHRSEHLIISRAVELWKL